MMFSDCGDEETEEEGSVYQTRLWDKKVPFLLPSCTAFAVVIFFMWSVHSLTT